MDLARYLEERPSKQFLIACAAFAAGIAAHSLAPQPSVWSRPAVAGAALGVVALPFLWRRVSERAALIALVFILLGWARFDAFLMAPPITATNGGEHVRIEGVAAARPELRESHQRIILEVRTADGQESDGRLLLRAPLEPRYRYGDILSVSCGIEAPGMIRGFDEARALLPIRVFSVCNFPESVRRVGRDANPVRSAIYDFAEAFTGGLRRDGSPSFWRMVSST